MGDERGPRWADDDIPPPRRARHPREPADDDVDPADFGPPPGPPPRRESAQPFDDEEFDDDFDLAGVDPPPWARPVDGEQPADVEDFPYRRVIPLDPEPSRRAATGMFPTEEFRGEWRRHWIWLVKRLLALGLFVVVISRPAGGRVELHLDPPAKILILAATLIAAVAFGLDWWRTRFVLTDARVMLVGGPLGRRTSSLPLRWAGDLRFRQSGLGAALNYATFAFDKAGRLSGLRRVEDLPHPNELYLRTIDEIYDPAAVRRRMGQYGT